MESEQPKNTQLRRRFELGPSNDRRTQSKICSYTFEAIIP